MRLKRILQALAICLLGTLCLAGCIGQREYGNHINEDSQSEIVIGVEPLDYFAYLADDGSWTGIDVDLAREACRRLGYRPEFKRLVWGNHNALLRDRQIDCIWCCFSMTDREKQYTWAGPYLYDRHTLIVSTYTDLKDWQQLSGRKIGVQRGTQTERILLDGGGEVPQNCEILAFDDLTMAMAALKDGMVDAVAAHESLLKLYADKEPERYRLINHNMRSIKIGVAFARDGNVILARALDKTLQEMKEDGTIAAIVDKYGLPSETFVYGGSN